jgi:mono/diheme cytochrome c family protein
MSSWTSRLISTLRAAPLAWAVLAAACSNGNDDAVVRSAEDASATLRRYCADCHNPAEFSGNFSVTTLDSSALQDHPEIWERIVRKLRTRTMPPQDAPHPDAATYDSFATWLEASLDASAKPNPGAPMLRRLNRAEYANAIRDLLDLEIDVAGLLPPDDSAFGFDNIGDLLTFSPTLLERYLSAADRVSAMAVGDSTTAAGAQTYTVRGDQSQATHLEQLPLGTVGGVSLTHVFPLDAEYELGLTLFRNNLEVIRGLEHPHQIEIAIDGRRVFLEGVGGDYEDGREGTTVNELADSTDARLKVRVPIEAGPRVVTATFVRKMGQGTNRLRPFDRSNSGTYDGTGRPHIETLTVTGPYSPTGPGDTPSRRRIFTCSPVDANDEPRCAREILASLARRAYRRPIDAADIDRLLPFFEDGRAYGGFEVGIQLALRRILASPSFAFRIEAEPDGVPNGTPFEISDGELATRLSFFLWSSIPDDELLSLAEKGKLSDANTLERQVRRMIADPKSQALVDNFAGQWLHLRNLDNINPNSDEFPDFDNNLRQSFKQEAELFFASIMNEDRSLLDLMTADYTFVDERLAHHYGIPQVYGSHFRRVQLGPDMAPRHGLLGKGGILMATSHADRTAPTLRGKWVLENLLGSPPPAPPANVPALETEPGAAPKTMRERMQSHRANPSCAGCHQILDPLGFAMENFDAIGGWRTLEAGRAIDASGSFMDGRAVDGAAELREALLADPKMFVGTFTEKLLTYALGRGLQHYDMPVVRRVLESADDDGYRFSDVVLGIVESTPFRMRVKAPAAQDEVSGS